MVVREGSRTRLVLDGVVFWDTARPVSGERAITLDTGAIIILWNEDDGVLNIPHRAIGTTDSGQPPLPRTVRIVGEADYRVMLRQREWVPWGNDGHGVAEPATPEGLNAAAIPGGNRLFIVQFVCESMNELAEAVRATGAVIREYVESDGYIVEMGPGAKNLVEALPFVRWVGAYHPAYKLDPLLRVECFDDRGVPRENPARRYNLSMFERGEIQKRIVAERLRALGAQVGPAYGPGFILEATLTPAQLREALRMTEVLWCGVSQVSQPGGVAGAAPELTPCDSAAPIAHQLSGIDCLHALNFRGQGVRGATWGENGFQLRTDQPPYADILSNWIDSPCGGARPAPLRQCIGSEYNDMCLEPIPECPVCPSEQGMGYYSDLGNAHGTAVFGILFGYNAAHPDATGILPCAEQGIFAARRIGNLCLADSAARVKTVEQLADCHRAVFQSSSEGTNFFTTLNYEAVARDLDDVVLRKDVLLCQMMYQAPGQCPHGASDQAWAKNVVSVGGVKIRSSGTPSTDRSTHCWGCPSSVTQTAGSGPAGDGRIKPDLVHVYDGVQTVSVQCPTIPPSCRQGACADFCVVHSDPMTCYDPSFYSTVYCDFGGTSAATPLTAGCFGLLFQMWAEGVFPGFGGNPNLDVFDQRPHAATAKALMINTAFKYPITEGCPQQAGTNDFTRHNQGWGMPCLKARAEDSPHLGLLDLQYNLFIVDESHVFTDTAQSVQYQVNVPGTLPLKVTMVYTDPAANPGSSVHRVDDLDLRVISPNAGVYYYGNSGLETSNWTTAQGTLDSRNNVENVFIQNPEPGTWTIEVTCRKLPVDARPETPEKDIAFGLVVSGLGPAASHRGPDWDGDEKVSESDIAAFLADFTIGRADVNGDGRTTSEDFWLFIQSFFGHESPPAVKERNTP